jgi:2-C-methyl-D-erythritol 2,4-cyclodiphosphate synthase
MMSRLSVSIFAILLATNPIVAFTVAASSNSRTAALFASVSTEDDLLKPSYEIEPIATRIGHGFDIHRMAPIEEAGQPVVIGGVEITHTPQKVRTRRPI